MDIKGIVKKVINNFGKLQSIISNISLSAVWTKFSRIFILTIITIHISIIGRVFLNECQRVRVWFLRWLATKLVKETEPEENPKDFLSTQRTSNWL